ncbi:MAG: acetoacetate decarboxylase [Actinomyces sp.]|nr:MAG: acetoacetate decarboxylase [Actinomyces sp.]
MSDAPMIRPADIAGWPKLVIDYRTREGATAPLLPPGLGAVDDRVQIGVYCVPVQGEPEYGISIKVPATWQGTEGWYTLGLGIDQEAAIFISGELNGQPKFPCTIRYWRLGDEVHARATHQGYTFVTFDGVVTGPVDPAPDARTEHEWWTKYSRAIGGAEKSYDFPPHVVDVATTSRETHVEAVDGTLRLLDSPWDPVARLLPCEELISARLVHKAVTAREISDAGTLDPDAFWPHADVIGGSRWPGHRGGPRPDS